MSHQDCELKYLHQAEPSTLDLSHETLVGDAQAATVRMKNAAYFLRALDAADGWDDHDWIALADMIDPAANDCAAAADAEEAEQGRR